MRCLDEMASREYFIPEGELMENAGAALAVETLAFAREKLSKKPAGLKVAVCCGRGNNGGDGLAAARHLKKAGACAEAFIVPPAARGYGVLTVKNMGRAKAAGVEITPVEMDNTKNLVLKLAKADILLDALLGFGSVGKPAGPVRRMIELMNKSAKPVIAVDIPSGLNPDTGRHSGVIITAKTTFTLGFAKSGLMAACARPYTGDVKVLSIGYPKGLAERAKSRH